MMDEGAGIVIVGGGQAGARAAKAMRAAGYAASIRIFGAETHFPYERPLLSKTLLQRSDAPTPFVLSEESYAEMGIAVHRGCTVVGVDATARNITLGTGETVPYGQLLLATGSRLRPFELNGFPESRIFALRTIDDSRAIERRLGGRPNVVVVGGGFIGLEVAAALAGRGCGVKLIEAADSLLPRLGCPQASAMVLEHHRHAGVDVRLGVKVIAGDELHVELDDGARVAADFVVAGVGVLPETSLAEAAGLKVHDGIVVDEYGRTSDDRIFAAGDATRHYNPILQRHVRLESWENANLQAEAAGRTMAGQPTPSAEIPWLWSDQGSLNLQMAGVADRVDRVVVRGQAEGEDGMSVLQFNGDRLVGGVTINRGKEMLLIRRMLAAGQRFEQPSDLEDSSVPLRRFLPAKATT